jgi:hypothetical protein
MKLIKNTGNDRVIDELRQTLAPQSSLALASPAFSLFAFAELREVLEKLDTCRMIVPAVNGADLGLTGSANDLVFRNRLQVRWLARECAEWIRKNVELRTAPALLPQSILIVGKSDSEHQRVITGNCPFTTEGLGLTPGNQFSLIQCSERPEESAVLGGWFTSLWNTLTGADQCKAAFLARLQALVDPKAPAIIYYLVLFHVFKDLGNELDEERIVKSATGIRNTTVWKKLYKFQRDGVVGAIYKLESLGGCIIADRVGLGKTFDALAIIKYYELRNDRVLVLVPKRLRDNWTLYKANDRRNFLASDRFSVEKAGTGILDMINLCKTAGVATPQFRQEGGQFIQTLWRPNAAETAQVTARVTAQVGTKLALSRHQVLNPLLAEGLIEMTIPDKPRSSKQEYRLTAKGLLEVEGSQRAQTPPRPRTKSDTNRPNRTSSRRRKGDAGK